MALFEKLKNAFGFGDGFDANDDPIIGDDPDIDNPRKRNIYASTEHQQQPDNITDVNRLKATSDTDGTDQNISGPDAIFEKVVEIFNQALPDFLARSVDPAAERRLLYDALDEGMKAYVEQSRISAEHNCQRRFDAEKNKLQANIREMENRYRQYDDVRNEMSQKLLSIERQKRAMSAKMQELEMKVQTLEAEQEQYQLENKSLVNKLKVQGVHEKENIELNEELNNLRAELMRLRAAANQDMDIDGKSGSVDLDKLRAEVRAELRPEVEENVRQELADTLRSRITAEVRAELNATLTESIRQEVEQNAQAEINSLKAEKNKAEERIAQYHATIQRNMEMQVKSETRLRAENDEMRSLCQTNSAEIDRLRAELEQSKKDTLVAQGMVEQLRLQLQNKSESVAKETIESYDSSSEYSKSTVNRAKNGFQKPRNTDKNRSETQFDSKRNINKPVNRTAQRGSVRPQTQRHAPTPIEDILSDTDWVVSPSSLRFTGSQNKEQEKKGYKDNDSQLSLF